MRRRVTLVFKPEDEADGVGVGPVHLVIDAKTHNRPRPEEREPRPWLTYFQARAAAAALGVGFRVG